MWTWPEEPLEPGPEAEASLGDAAEEEEGAPLLTADGSSTTSVRSRDPGAAGKEREGKKRLK